YRLAFIKLASDKEEDRNQARESLEKAAKTDPAVAGRVLGEAWLRGRLSKEPDFDKAMQWWLIAADTNDVISIMLVARAYDGQFGFPDKRDVKKATEAYRKAAELGDPGAMRFLGEAYAGGIGVKRDLAQAAIWLRKALAAGDSDAEAVLKKCCP
ncbi:MAG: tetratricopeptide repeat protein, partial [Allosphingosinicella sp.]